MPWKRQRWPGGAGLKVLLARSHVAVACGRTYIHTHTHATRRNRHPPKTDYDIGWRMRRGCSGCLPGGGSRSNGQTDPQNWCNRKHVRLGPDKQCVCIDIDNLGPSKPDSVIVFTTDSECKNNSEMRTSQPPRQCFLTSEYVMKTCTDSGARGVVST